MTDEAKANQFVDEVFPAELEELKRRRSTVGDPREFPTNAADAGPHVDNELIGLALSGGGIRSASFSLGVVQGLIKAGLFNSIDYLSTVSGGGYTGACLSSLTHRCQNGERLIVDHAGETEPAALNHLRNGSNFFSLRGSTRSTPNASVIYYWRLSNFAPVRTDHHFFSFPYRNIF